MFCFKVSAKIPICIGFLFTICFIFFVIYNMNVSMIRLIASEEDL